MTFSNHYPTRRSRAAVGSGGHSHAADDIPAACRRDRQSGLRVRTDYFDGPDRQPRNGLGPLEVYFRSIRWRTTRSSCKMLTAVSPASGCRGGDPVLLVAEVAVEVRRLARGHAHLSPWKMQDAHAALGHRIQLGNELAGLRSGRAATLRTCSRLGTAVAAAATNRPRHVAQAAQGSKRWQSAPGARRGTPLELRMAATAWQCSRAASRGRPRTPIQRRHRSRTSQHSSARVVALRKQTSADVGSRPTSEPFLLGLRCAIRLHGCRAMTRVTRPLAPVMHVDRRRRRCR